MSDPRYDWVARLPARTLRELAALAPDERPEFADPARAAAELAAMLDAGTRPTVGWHLKHRAHRAPAEPRYHWVARLPARTLRELAALAPDDRPEFADPRRAAAELAEMLKTGTRPTVGWHAKHRARRDPAERERNDKGPPTRQPGQLDRVGSSDGLEAPDGDEVIKRTAAPETGREPAFGAMGQIRDLVAVGADRASRSPLVSRSSLTGPTLVNDEERAAVAFLPDTEGVSAER